MGIERGNSRTSGLPKSSSCQWIVTFQARLEICSNIVTELKALRFGLLLMRTKCILILFVNLDARVIYA